MVGSTLWVFLLFFSGFLFGVTLTRGEDRRLLAFNPKARERLARLRARLTRDPEGADPEPRVELARHYLGRQDPRAAAAELGDILRMHSDRAPVREVGRDVLRALLLKDLGAVLAHPTALLRQGIDYRPEGKKILLRLRDLALGGIVDLQRLEVHIEDFDPGRTIQPLPRVVFCRATVREERLRFALESRIDFTVGPLRELEIQLLDERIMVSGTISRFGVSVGFRVAASAQVCGSSRLAISFPVKPVVAGVIPLPIDFLIKQIARGIESKRPGAALSPSEATLEIDLLKLGLPPVEVNLREIRLRDGVAEVICGEERGAEVLERPVRVLDPKPEPRPQAADDGDEDGAPAEGLLSTLGGLLSGEGGSSIEQALARSAAALDEGHLEEAVIALRVYERSADLSTEPGARLIEELADLRMRTGQRDARAAARASLDRLLERRPGRARACFLLARWHLLDRDVEQAETQARVAVGLDPFYTEPYALLETALLDRGAVQAAARAREAVALLRGSHSGPERGLQAPRGILQGRLVSRLEHPDEASTTGLLVRGLQGTLAWLDAAADPNRGERDAWPVSEEELPRVTRMAREIATSLQMPAPQLVLRRGEGAAPLRLRGAWNPWVEVPGDTLGALDEHGLAFELGRSLYLIRSGRGFLTGLEDPQLELLYALLRTLGEDARRVERADAGERPGLVAGAISDAVESIEKGWVVRGRDLDPWVAPEIRRGVQREALAYREADPAFRDLHRLQRAVAASADRAGLLYSTSLTGSVQALLRLEPSLQGTRGGLEQLQGRTGTDAAAWRVGQLLRFAVDPALEELELVAAEGEVRGGSKAAVA